MNEPKFYITAKSQNWNDVLDTLKILKYGLGFCPFWTNGQIENGLFGEFAVSFLVHWTNRAGAGFKKIVKILFKGKFV